MTKPPGVYDGPRRMTTRTVKDAIRHRLPRLTAALKEIQRWLGARSSPYGALDRAHEISAILGPETQIQIDRDGVWLRDPDGCYWKHVPNVYGPFLGLERGLGFESTEVSWATGYLVPGAVFLDIGANIGVFAVSVTRNTRDTSAVAVEPVGRTFYSLAANVARNGLASRIKTLRAAVGEGPGQILLTNKLNAANHVVPLVRERPPCSEELVQQTSLDRLVDTEGLTRLDLIKLDVEGFELSVLKGARATLTRFYPAVLIEIESRWTKRYQYSPREIFALLGALGYVPHYFVGTGLVRASDHHLSLDSVAVNNFVFLPPHS